MDRVYQANAIETPPSTTASSGSYPTAGSKASGQLATVPGPYWFYSITEEIRNALIAAGVTPDAAKVNQLAEAMGKFLLLSGGVMTGDVIFDKGFIKNTTSQASFGIYSGQAAADGARLVMYNNTHKSTPGMFTLTASDGLNVCGLQGRVNGALTWGGKDLLRSINGKTAGVDGDVPFTIGQSTYETVDDLNSLTDAGVYGVNSSNRSNYPDGGGSNGILIVYNDGSGHGRQVYYRIGTVGSTDKDIFTRAFNTNSGSFGQWMRDVYLVESYKSGANWYRKYSDGWIEQGGNVEAPNSGWTAIPLHIPFSKKDYNLMTCNSGATTDAFATKVETSGKNTTTTAYACVYHSNGTGIRWEAKGY